MDVCVYVSVRICVYVGVRMLSVYVFAALFVIFFSHWRALLVSYFMFLLWHHQFSTVAISGHYRQWLPQITLFRFWIIITRYFYSEYKVRQKLETKIFRQNDENILVRRCMLNIPLAFLALPCSMFILLECQAIRCFFCITLFDITDIMMEIHHLFIV